MARCICCGKPGQFSILLAIGVDGSAARVDERYYLPNQVARKEPSNVTERWFCGEHMRSIEDAVRSTILYHQAESGEMLVAVADGR